MRRIDAALLGARLLALSFIVFGISGLIAFINVLMGNRPFDRFNLVALISTAVPFVGGIVLWLRAPSFATGMELDAMLLEQDDDDDHGESLDDEETADAGDTFAPQATRSGAGFLMIGSVLLGLWVLSTAVPGLVSGIADLAWRPSGSLFSDGDSDQFFRRQEVLALIFAGVKVLFGVALIAGRQRVAAVVERLRYAPAHPPSHDDLPE